MSNKTKRCVFLTRLLIAFVLAIVFTFVPVHELYVTLPVMIFAFLLAGFEVIINGLKGIVKRHILDENFLMIIAGAAAFTIGEYTEGVAIVLFYGLGEFLQETAVDKSRRNVTHLLDIRPDYANLNGERVDPKKVNVGDIITIKPGERVPLDAIVTSGVSYIDTKAITGEPVPRHVKCNDEVYSGTINLESVILARVIKPYGESTVARILNLVENASAHKSKSEKFITKFARIYTPIVVACAILVAVVPPTIIGWTTFNTWLYAAINFLVISCPCALVVSIPVSVFGGIGAAARNGILIKGGNYLEALNGVTTLAFDKTGTLTNGVFEVTKVIADGIDTDEFVELVATCEKDSPHPIAKSILEYWGKPVTKTANVTERTGMGIVGKIDGRTLHIGNKKLLGEIGIENAQNYDETAVYVTIDKKYAGTILIADTVKEGVKTAIGELSLVGINRTVMLTGDNETTAIAIAREVGISEFHANLLPQDKVTVIEKLKNENNGLVAFVGDGMNDAPSLALSDVGIAIGDIGSDAAIEAADIVLLNGDIGKIATAKRTAKKTRRIIIENIMFALSVKFAIMGVSFAGSFIPGFAGINIWFAIIADVGVSLLAILNAIRCLYIKKR